MCANNNMQVTNITTPANYFHLLRRQLHRDFRTPLVVLTPKSLLRHPLCASSLSDFTSGSFHEILGDHFADVKKVKRVLLCTGKIYYDLLQEQKENQRTDVAIVRVEQIYPFPEAQLEKELSQYKGAEIIWVQEEPKNMGAWTFLSRYDFSSSLKYIGRKSSASPATGFKKVHDEEQEAIIKDSFSL